MPRTHEDLADERARMLEEVLPCLFKGDAAPPKHLIKAVAVHLALARKPEMLQDPRAVKADPIQIYDKYGPTVEIVQDAAAQQPTLCPISQSPIAVPWVGTCGHAFEEHVVLSYLERHPRCPVLGCGKSLTLQKRKK